MDLKKYIASIPGFPKEGIIFRDVTPILETPEAMHYVVGALCRGWWARVSTRW